MARYPVKMLKDEQNQPFVPMVSAESIYTNDDMSFEEKFNTKLEASDLKEGAGIILEQKGNSTTISVDFGATDNIIDNLDTTVAGQGPLDARQGNILKNMIPAIVDNLESSDATKTLSANQGRVLKDMSVPTGGATGQVLKKSSNNDHELEWGDAADPNAIVGDGSIMKIIELTYAEYKTLESNGELREDTEYHITDVENGTATYLTTQDIEEIVYDKTANHTTENQVRSMIENETTPLIIQVENINNRLNNNVVLDHTTTSAGPSLTVDGLDLQGDGGIYNIYFTYKGSNAAVSSLIMRVNNFTTGYYTIYSRAWANTPGLGVGNINSQSYYKTNDTSWQCGEIIDDTYGFINMTVMKGPDGIKMNANQSLLSQDVAYGGTYDCNLYSTPENLTKITFTNQAGNIQPGSRLVITKGII